MRARVGDQVRVIRGALEGREGTVDEVRGEAIVVRLARADWPFPTLTDFDRHDLVVIDRNEDVEEALL